MLVLPMRLFRARQPRLGWSPILDKGFKVNYIFIVVVILLVIAFTILNFYTLNSTLLKAGLWIQRTGILYFVIFNLIAPVLYFLALLLPRAPEAENFGIGSMNAKMIILGIVIFFNLFISGFRMGTSESDARPLSDPAWYDTRAAFYIIELGFEIVITYLLLLSRFDTRFWVPNGSRKPGDYSRIDPNNSQRRRMKVTRMEESTDADASSEKSHKADSAVA
ncbi:hypothetical protein LECACI_7A000992 [Lecanosticta acicola]|uniref:Uncharacterized protein n=1 Tax=Lecanosticta acicola TaxID=111012 RepID=A0AAI8YS52_9PEZI|nr:hypothetical protein LECACI_7A000992 [Lecanosticta acicola]